MNNLPMIADKQGFLMQAVYNGGKFQYKRIQTAKGCDKNGNMIYSVIYKNESKDIVYAKNGEALFLSYGINDNISYHKYDNEGNPLFLIENEFGSYSYQKASEISTEYKPLPLPLLPSMEGKIRNYQLYARDFIIKRKRNALFLSMGFGKTLVAISALHLLDTTDNVLIIAPKAIARVSWPDELEKWGYNGEVKSLSFKLNGRDLSRAQKEDMYEDMKKSKNTVYLMSSSQTQSLFNYFENDMLNGKLPFNNIIVDESQEFKNPSSERTKSFLNLAGMVERITLMSGTPMPNGLLDLYSQIFAIDFGDRLGKYITEFKDEYFNYYGKTSTGIPTNPTPKPTAQDTIEEKLKDICLSMKNKELKLPDLIVTDHKLSLSTNQRSKYETLRKENVLSIVNETIEKMKIENEEAIIHNQNLSSEFKADTHKVVDITENNVIAKTAAVLSMKLSQLASGAMYVDDDRNYMVLHDLKLKKLEKIIRDSDDNILVLFNFQSDKSRIFKYFEDTDIDINVFDGSKSMTDAWNAKKYKVMLLQPRSNARGINIQKGGHTIVWFSITWNLEHYEQANARLHRSGQKNKTVIMHRLLVTDTIDYKISKALADKATMQNHFLNAMAPGEKNTEFSNMSSIENTIIKNEIENAGIDLKNMIKEHNF